MQFFNLPFDVRLMIYQKARFIEAKSRLEKELAKKPVAREHISLHGIHTIISFKLSETKIMYLEQFTCPDNDDSLIVDVCEYSDLAVFLFVEDETVRVSIGSELSMRHVRSRVWKAGDVPTLPDKTYVQWFKKREIVF